MAKNRTSFSWNSVALSPIDIVVVGALMSVFSSYSFAVAKAPIAPACGGTPGITTPNPTRKILLQQIATKAFQLPNGAMVSLSDDLQSMLNTAVTSANGLSPTDPSQVSPCDNHIELRSTVTTFQANVASIGASFGFTPAGPVSGGLTSVTGTVAVNIGTIAMDFSVWDCIGTQCSAVAASTANQTTAGVNMSVQVNFSVATTGGSFIYNTPLGVALRQVMMNGISQLVSSPKMNYLPWQAQVKESVPSAGLVIFDAGAQSGIFSNQSFEVYAPTDTSSTGVCNVFQAVAYMHTSAADTVSSTALIDRALDSRGVLAGDVVMIRMVNQ